MYAFMVGFNNWALRQFIYEQAWRRTNSKDAGGWEHDGQIVRDLKTEHALIGMDGRNRKAILVRSEKRKGYVCDAGLTKTVKNIA